MATGLKTAVVGATGFSGEELTRLLGRHPKLQAPLLLGRSQKQDAGREDFGSSDAPMQPLSWDLLKQKKIELLFLATPHEVSRALAPEAIAAGLRVIDLSGAWRLKREQHRATYGFKDDDSLSAETLAEMAVYGLPELNSECIARAKLVANPGCYATSVILALAPLLKADLVDRNRGIISDSKSGVSGAGKALTSRTQFVSVADNFSAYSLFNHRHNGEIAEQLGLDTSEFTFTPHLLPIPRGILSTLYVYLNRAMTSAEIEACFRGAYAEKPYVRILANPSLPEIRHSLHTNFCDLGFALADDGRRLIVISCLDNLIKGAAGQAVQNMNLMYGWDEKEGLQ